MVQRKYLVVLSLLVPIALAACERRGRRAILSSNPGGIAGASGATAAPPPPPSLAPPASPPPEQALGNLGETGGTTGGTTGGATGGIPPAQPKADPAALAYINGWNGEEDEIPAGSRWGVKGAAGTAPTPPGGSPTAPPGGTTPPAATGPTYDGQVAAILNRACVSCHSLTGSRTASPMETYDKAKSVGSNLVGRVRGGSMPPGGALPPAEVQALVDWEKGGFQKGGASGLTPPAGGGGAGGGNPVLEITEQRYGNYLNNQVLTGKVGQTLRIVNKRATEFTIHTNGQPFPHGNAIPPGGSEDYPLEAPYDGEGDIYEHTDGSINTDRLIKLKVTQ